MLIDQYGGIDRNSMHRRTENSRNQAGGDRPQFTQGIIRNVTEDNHLKQRYSVELSTIGRKNIIHAVPVQTFAARNGEGDFRPLVEGQLVYIFFKENQETKPVIILGHPTNGPTAGPNNVWADGNYPEPYNASLNGEEYDPPFISPDIVKNPDSARKTHTGVGPNQTKEVKFLNLIDSDANIHTTHLGHKTEISKHGTITSALKDVDTVLDIMYDVLFKLQKNYKDKENSYSLELARTKQIDNINYLDKEKQETLNHIKSSIELQLENIHKHQEALTQRQDKANEANGFFGADSTNSLVENQYVKPKRNKLDYFLYNGTKKLLVSIAEKEETFIRGAEALMPLAFDSSRNSSFITSNSIEEIASNANQNLSSVQKAINEFKSKSL